MTEHVQALNLGVRWQPNAPSAILVSDDYGKTALALNRHPDDPDERCVVLVWTGTRSACLADPNDAAISEHRLYRHGLNEVLWAGAVHDSDAIRALEVQNRVHPSHDRSRFERLVHHVVLLKGCVAEVVAEEFSVQRFEGTTIEAATACMDGQPTSTHRIRIRTLAGTRRCDAPVEHADRGRSGRWSAVSLTPDGTSSGTR